jgi:hypothetical protein|tara:strand:- start:5008 stop:5151 length:144 start_codon:yes stop_codon:yes gene_type:complete
MVIGDFNIAGVSFMPTKAKPPLTVDTDAVLVPAVSFEGFEMLAGWDT